MSTSEVKLSSKGQVVLPKETRKKMGLKKGDKLKIRVDEETKTILLQPSVAPPKEIFFIRAGTRLTSSVLRESEQLDETKVRRLLKAIGAD